MSLNGLDSLFQKTPIIIPNEQTVYQGDAPDLKMSLSSWSLTLWNFEPRRWVSALHFFARKIPQMALWHGTHSDKCFFFLNFLFQTQFLFHLLEANQGDELSHILRTPENDHLIFCKWPKPKTIIENTNLGRPKVVTENWQIHSSRLLAWIGIT